jgi:LysM repeat protein
MGGSSSLGSHYALPGVYGTLGTPASGNIPGGRYGAATWTDANGKFWLFGGEGADSAGNLGLLNDLWRFDPATRQWTWMGGNNLIDQLGVYGTLGTPSTANIPGSRGGAVSFLDPTGNFWLFGGAGIDANGNSGWLNDLWKVNPSTGEWTWVSGNKTLQNLANPGQVYGQIGVYGTLGEPAPGNVPGTRYCAAGWSDGNGNLWLFGGWGFDGFGFWGYLNDFWQFSPSTGEWTWVGGNDFEGQSSIYGVEGQPAPGNIPGARCEPAYATDSSGNFWLFAGDGMGSGIGYPTDLWLSSPANREWAWISGSQSGDAAGQYSILGIPSATANPAGRGNAAAWSDSSGNLWLFGGQYFSTHYNDLWEFHPYKGNVTIAVMPAFSPVAGSYSSSPTVTISDATPGATIYYSLNGSAPATQYTAPITVSSNETINAVAVASGYANSALASASYTLVPTFSLAATPAALTINSGSQGTITLTLTPQNGFNSPVNFTCSGLPSDATCSFTPATVTPSGSATTVQLDHLRYSTGGRIAAGQSAMATPRALSPQLCASWGGGGGAGQSSCCWCSPPASSAWPAAAEATAAAGVVTGRKRRR